MGELIGFVVDVGAKDGLVLVGEWVGALDGETEGAKVEVGESVGAKVRVGDKVGEEEGVEVNASASENSQEPPDAVVPGRF